MIPLMPSCRMSNDPLFDFRSLNFTVIAEAFSVEHVLLLMRRDLPRDVGFADIVN